MFHVHRYSCSVNVSWEEEGEKEEEEYLQPVDVLFSPLALLSRGSVVFRGDRQALEFAAAPVPSA